jgi:3-oxoacyl-[acyl-carrier-protein] synthase II
MSKIPCKVAAQIPRGSGQGQFDATKYILPEDTKIMPEFVKFAMAATAEAMQDAQWKPSTEEQKNRSGVAIGNTIASVSDYESQVRSLYASEGGYKKMSPYFVTKILPNMASGYISMRYGLQGPNHCASTACATGAHAIGDAYRMIMLDDADVMVAGATDSSITPLGISAFARARALSTKFNETPQRASRPFDADRDGFVMGEGAGLLVLEELEHAIRRGAKIYAEIRGFGMSGDAHHLTAPRDDGGAAFKAMQAALRSSGLGSEYVDYINAHATSTPLGDKIEALAIARLFGERSEASKGNFAVSSTKGATGHLLAAAGAIEAIYTILAIKNVRCLFPLTSAISCANYTHQLYLLSRKRYRQR